MSCFDVNIFHLGWARTKESDNHVNVIVRKKDGTIRFFMDVRRLTSKTLKDAYPIAQVEEALQLLAWSQTFTQLDLRSGYWQVEIREDVNQKLPFMLEPWVFTGSTGCRFDCVMRRLPSSA